jgi:hypothetical protein
MVLRGLFFTALWQLITEYGQIMEDNAMSGSIIQPKKPKVGGRKGHLPTAHPEDGRICY